MWFTLLCDLFGNKMHTLDYNQFGFYDDYDKNGLQSLCMFI